MTGMQQYNRAQLYAELMDPMAEALNRLDADDFRSHFTRAEQLISSGSLNADMARSLEYFRVYLDFLQHVAFRNWQVAEEVYPETRRRLLAASAGPESDLMRRRYYLQLRIVADNMGLETLPLEEFRDLFSMLSFQEMHAEQWYFTSNFAFRYRDLETITRAYEQFLLYRDEADDELFQWVRLSVMYRLLREEAQPRHIEKLILSIRTAANAREVQALLMPEIESQGLLNEELRRLMERTISQLEERA